MLGRKSKTINQLRSDLTETQAQLERIRRGTEIQSRAHSQQIADLDGRNRGLAAEVERLRIFERALKELEEVRQREQTTREAVSELIIQEDHLISLIQQSKQVITEIINQLRFVMDNHNDLLNGQYADYFRKRVPSPTRGGSDNLVRLNTYMESIHSQIRDFSYRGYRRGDRLPDELIDIIKLSMASIFGNFMMLYNAVHQLRLLVQEEKRDTALIRQYDDFVINYMGRMYKNIVDNVRQGLSNFGGSIEQLGEGEIKAVSERGDKQNLIRQLNQRLLTLTKNILIALYYADEVIKDGAGLIELVFPEFFRIKGKLQEHIKTLFSVFVNHINKNEALVNKIVESNDRDIVKAQEKFNSFLRHFADDFDLSIRQRELDFR